MKTLLKYTLLSIAVSISVHFYLLVGIHITWFVQNVSGGYWLRVKDIYSDHWLMILLLTVLVIFVFISAIYFKINKKIIKRLTK